MQRVGARRSRAIDLRMVRSFVEVAKHPPAANDSRGRREEHYRTRCREACARTSRVPESTEEGGGDYACDSVDRRVQSHHRASAVAWHALQQHRRDGWSVQRHTELVDAASHPEESQACTARKGGAERGGGGRGDTGKTEGGDREASDARANHT